MQYKTIFNKNNLDDYLLKLAKEYKRITKSKIHAEIILIGGASIIINYGFRDMTNDIDAIINASVAMKEAINNVGDEFGLENGWLNDDFKITSSYSPKIIQYSTFYKTFDHIIDVRTIKKEYLIAMKLKSFRQYKSDISDIIGIILTEKKQGNDISLNKIRNALIDLYGENFKLSKEADSFINNLTEKNDLVELFNFYKENENLIEDKLTKLGDKDKAKINEKNIDDVITFLKNKDNN